jgi:hypothetical protein
MSAINVHVIEATSDPVAAPTVVGQHWINTATGEQWLATGTSVIADWSQLPDDATAAAYTYRGNNTATPTPAADLQDMILGTPGFAASDALIQISKNVNSYTQAVIQNRNSGTVASSDLVVCNNNSTDSTYYGDFGINSSGFTGSGSFQLPNAVYLYAHTGDLVVGTFTANTVRFLANNAATDALQINSSNALVTPALTGFLKGNGTSAVTAVVGDVTVSTSWTPGTTSGPTTTATTSATAPTLSQMTKTFTPSSAANTTVTSFSGSFSNNKSATITIAIFIDGTLQSGTQRSVDVNNSNACLATTWSGSLSVASHTIDVRWWVSGNTGTAIGVERSIFFMEQGRG